MLVRPLQLLVTHHGQSERIAAVLSVWNWHAALTTITDTPFNKSEISPGIVLRSHLTEKKQKFVSYLGSQFTLGLCQFKSGFPKTFGVITSGYVCLKNIG